MTVSDIYTSTVIKTNRNKGTQNVSLDKYRFVLIYNENQIKRVEYILEHKNDDNVREIQELIVNNKKLTSANTNVNDRAEFKIPDDMLDLSSVYAIAKKGDCKVKLKLWESKDQNYNEVIEDSNNTPSFDYEESFYNIQGGKIAIYKDETFEVTDCILTYYKYPNKIDIEGYIKEDDVTNSTNIQTTMSDRFINKVISMVAEDFARNNQDTQAVSLNQNRITTNK